MPSETVKDQGTSSTCPESTIESAQRRDFLRKAALVTAGASLGTSVIAKSLVPESSANSGASTVTTSSYNSPGKLAV